jgi:hypothetical protein
MTRNTTSTKHLLIIPGGFQLLHAVYVVERFLENLVKRHCQFHIAFFEGIPESNLPLIETC